jgi:hypothetical protein
MKKIGWLVLTVLVFSTAWAWRSSERVTFVSDDGAIVGVGEWDDDKLELDILKGFSGFVRINLGAESLEGFVNADGTVIIVRNGAFVDLRDDLASFGLGLELEREDRLGRSPRDGDRDDDDWDDDNWDDDDFDDRRDDDDDDWDDDRDGDRDDDDDWDDERDDDRDNRDDDHDDDHDDADDDDWDDDWDDDDLDDDQDDHDDDDDDDD